MRASLPKPGCREVACGQDGVVALDAVKQGGTGLAGEVGVYVGEGAPLQFMQLHGVVGGVSENQTLSRP